MMPTQLTIHPHNRQCFSRGPGWGEWSLRTCYPEGIAAISRWLSKAIPPEKRVRSQPIPEGLQPCESLSGSHRLESLRDTGDAVDMRSGGLVALNQCRSLCSPQTLRQLSTLSESVGMRPSPPAPLPGGEGSRRSFGRIATSIVIFAIASSAIAAEPNPPPVPEIKQADAVTDPAPAKTTPPPDSPLIEPGAETPASETETMSEEPSDAEALLDEALAAMDRAVQALDRDEPTPEAVQSQQLAVDRLKELLNAASQSQSSHNSSQGQNSSSSQEPSDPKNDPKAESNSSDPSGGGGRRADDQNSAESSENVEGPTLPGSGVLAPGAKANSVWGHLPPRDRESLFRSLSDSFLPEYEAQIRRYYEAIAEKK